MNNISVKAFEFLLKIRQWITLVILGAISLPVFIWVSFQEDKDSIAPASKTNNNAPNLTLINSTSYHFDETGNQQYELTADQIDHYEESEMAYFIHPSLTNYDEEATWNATSNTGQADLKTDIITLQNQVRIDRFEGDEQLTLRTSILDIDTVNNIAENDVLTVVHSGNSYMESKGFLSNFNTGETLLKSNVRGTYVGHN